MLPFNLPRQKDCSIYPRWNGKEFVIGDIHTPVLEYSENLAGWSDDLTALHEEVVGDSHPIDIASRKDAIVQVKRFMPSAQVVIMDIGCSSGFLLHDLVKSFPEAKIIGVDVVKDPLYRLAKALPTVPLIRFDLLQNPLPDESVDVIIMLNVLEHIEDDVLALKKAFRLLKKGGSLIVEVPAGPYFYDAYDSELHHFRRYSSSELQSKLIGAGFKVRRKSHLGFLLFPAFGVVKLFNKWSPFQKNKMVFRKQAAVTSGSVLVRLAMVFETKVLSRFQLPFGIRVLAVAVKK
jgi:SAM-dependent methyltransferase